MRSSVVLPLPLGPRIVTTSPAATARSTGASACTRPNVLATPASSIPTAPDTAAERTDGRRPGPSHPGPPGCRPDGDGRLWPVGGRP